jgi:hypothetical protein
LIGLMVRKIKDSSSFNKSQVKIRLCLITAFAK